MWLPSLPDNWVSFCQDSKVWHVVVACVSKTEAVLPCTQQDGWCVTLSGLMMVQVSNTCSLAVQTQPAAWFQLVSVPKGVVLNLTVCGFPSDSPNNQAMATTQESIKIQWDLSSVVFLRAIRTTLGFAHWAEWPCPLWVLNKLALSLNNCSCPVDTTSCQLSQTISEAVPDIMGNFPLWIKGPNEPATLLQVVEWNSCHFFM